MSKATSRRTSATAMTKIQPTPRSTKPKPNPRVDRLDPQELPFYSDLIVLNDPGWNHASSQEWMRGVAAISRSIDSLNLYNPKFAFLVREWWHTLSSDVELEAFTIVDEFSRKGGPALIPAHTMLAQVFCILEGCDCFQRVQPYYQFVFPSVVHPDAVREAVYQLLDTKDYYTETVHPETILTCIQPLDLPPELSRLEKSPKSFIYRSPG